MNSQLDIIKDISLLYELSLAVGKSIDLEENASHFLQTLIVRKNLSFASIWIHGKFLGDSKDPHSLYLINGYPNFKVRDTDMQEGHPICEKFHTQAAFSVFRQDPDFEDFIQESNITRGAFGILRLDKVGFIKMYDNKRKAPFTDLELNQLKQVASKMATSLKGSISYLNYKNELHAKTLFAKELDQKKSYLQSVNAFAYALLSQNTLEEIAHKITDSTIDKFGFEDCIVYLLDEEKGHLWQASAYGPKDAGGKILDPITIPLGHGIVGTVGQTGIPECIGDTSQDARYIVDDEERFSELTVPIIANKKVVGVIDSEHSQKNYFTEEHLETLTTIAGLAATKIKYARWRTRQQETQQELINSEKKLRAILNSAMDAVVTINKASLITEWNNQAENMFGWTRDEVMGKSLRDFIIPHHLRDAHQNGMKNFFKTGHGPVLNNRIEVPALHKSGREFPVELSIVPLQTKGEYAFSAFLRDITQQKEEAEKRELLLKQLEKANSELQEFAYVVSHDLKAPLRAIGSLAHWLEEDQGDKLDEDGIDQLKMLQGRVTRMGEFINGILDYSKVGQSKSKSEIVDLGRKVDRTIDLIHLPDHIKANKVGEWPQVMINRIRILQVFQNLISNAVKFMDKEQGEIEVGVESRESDWLFWVKDNGPGIDPKFSDRIFRIFQTLNPRDKVEGTGIGLSIVKKIINLYGGEIWLESKPDLGSTFFFTLPHSIQYNPS